MRHNEKQQQACALRLSGEPGISLAACDYCGGRGEVFAGYYAEDGGQFEECFHCNGEGVLIA